MEYGLITNITLGKIIIDESAKEDFKELMSWTEKEFKANTFTILNTIKSEVKGELGK